MPQEDRLTLQKTGNGLLPPSCFNNSSNETMKNTNLTGSFPIPQLAIQHPAGHHSFNPEQVKFKTSTQRNNSLQRRPQSLIK